MDPDVNEVYALLRHLDHPPPPVTMEAIAARARRGARSDRWRWAAAVLLTTTLAGVAYATPGSPLPAWVARATERLIPTRLPPPPDAVRAPVQSAPYAGAGIAQPPGRELLIVFAASPEPGGTLRVALTDASDVTIRASTDAVDFTSERDRVRIEIRQGTPDFEVTVPRAAPKVEIRIADAPVFRKDGSEIVLGETSSLASDAWLIPLAPPSR
jgi:hypothetical protein